jgi:hypothetical protein
MGRNTLHKCFPEGGGCGPAAAVDGEEPIRPSIDEEIVEV